MVDVLAAPHRLEQRVGEAKDEQVLHRLLAEVVVDAEDLRLVEGRGHGVVERARARQVVAERLLEDDARPRAPGRLCPGGATSFEAAQPLDDGTELRRRHREVEEAIAPRAPLGVDALEVRAQRLVRASARSPRHARSSCHARSRPTTAASMGLRRENVRDGLLELGAERLVGLLAPRHADDGEAPGKQAAPREVVEGRDELAAREVPGRAEDDDGAGVAGAVLDEAAAQRVGRRGAGSDEEGV